MKAVFLDFATMGPGDVDSAPLAACFSSLDLHAVTPPEEVTARLAGAQVALLNKVRLGAAEFAELPELKLVCLAATGTDNVDLEAASRHGIAVCNIRDYCTPSLVQHTFALLLALTQHLPEYRKLMSGGAWSRADQFTLLDTPVRELAGKTFGIVGYGNLGSAVGRVAESFGMRVIAAGDEPRGNVERLPLTELLKTADVLSLHCPLTADTAKLINANTLALMRSDAVLINTARGGLVDSAALMAALKSGQIAAAGIDVLAEEPPVNGDALLDEELPNLIITPHMAWGAQEARVRALEEMIANVQAFIAGEPRNRVNTL